MRLRRCSRLKGQKPIFGICLGHQIFGLALGGKTYKLKFGHHGGNHPILNHRDGQGGDYGAEPQLQRGPGVSAGGCGADAYEPER